MMSLFNNRDGANTALAESGRNLVKARDHLDCRPAETRPECHESHLAFRHRAQLLCRPIERSDIHRTRDRLDVRPGECSIDKFSALP